MVVFISLQASMAKATQENDKLRAQNKELNQDIAQIQGLVGDFAKAQQNNDSIIAQLKSLETQNKTHADSIEEKNKLLADFSERIKSMKEQGFGGRVTMDDLKEIREDLDEATKRNDLLEDQNAKLKSALEGCHLTQETFKKEWDRVIRSVSKDDFTAAFNKWIERSQKCIRIGGGYVEK